MTPTSWEQLKGLFDRLRPMSRSRRHAALLDSDLDASQRSALDGLLACDDEMGSFLERAWAAEPGSPFASEPWPEGHCVSGRYRVIRHIGRGGMGDVYEADDLELPTRVALKRLRPEAVSDPGAIERLRREVDLARRVAHPNVCRIFDVGRDMTEAGGDGTLFLSMELLDGETLEALLARNGPLRETEAFTIASHICAGLEAAHAAGVIHRDLKTSNIMLVPAAGGMRAVITDFG